MDWRLRHYRAQLVRKYRVSPGLFPDGIEGRDDRWYGDGSAWPDDLVDIWASERWINRMAAGDQAGADSVITKVPEVITVITSDDNVITGEGGVDNRKKQVREAMRRYRARKLMEAARGKPDAT